MAFSSSQKKRFYQVYPQDSLTTVGSFRLVGSLVTQRSLFLNDAGEIAKVCESGGGRHAEEIFIGEYAKTLTSMGTSYKEKATLSLMIKILYSPCSKCRTELKNFFASLPQHGNYSLCIQFANLYHESRNSSDNEIMQLANWSQSMESINVNTTFKPLCVTQDPDFNSAVLSIPPEKIREREAKDKNILMQIDQVSEHRRGICQEFETKLSINPTTTKANELKAHGNTSLQKGDLQTAIRFYTEAISLDSSNYKIYSNRSLAFCKAKMYKEALQDAETSIQLKADWTKGYYHKGRALMHLGQFSEAAASYNQALKMEPRNQEIKEALSVVNEKLMIKRMATGLSKAIDVPSRPPTKAEIQKERSIATMKELHSDKKIRTLLKTGNALNSVPPAVRKALANCTSNKEVSSNEKLPTETYTIHHEKVTLANGSVRSLSLNVRIEFSHETVSGSGRVKIITRYYRLIYEWK